MQAAASRLEGSIQAAEQAGEFPAGSPLEINGGVLSADSGTVGQSLSPIRAAISTVGTFFKGLVGFLKQPKLLIPILILAALWVGLWFLRDSDHLIVKLLSFLSFSNIGKDRGLVGSIGTVFGKGTVAAFWASLFSGGIPALFKGIGGMIKGSGEKRGPLQLAIGALVGAALYFAFSGIGTASTETAMSGIAGAALALESIGKKNSPLYGLAQGLTSSVQNEVRVSQKGKAQSLLSGLFLGFVIAGAVMCFVGG